MVGSRLMVDFEQIQCLRGSWRPNAATEQL